MRLFYSFGSLVIAIALTPPLLSQTGPLQETYLQQVYLLRDYGQKKDLTLKEGDVSKYKGTCNRAVEVDDVQFDQGTVTFQLMLIGEATPSNGQPFIMCTEDGTQAEKLSITGFNSHESQAELEKVINRVLLTSEAFLASYRIPTAPSVSEPTLPLSRNPDTPQQAILKLNPVYPIDAMKGKINVEAEADVTIGRDGRVYEVKITKGEGTPLADELIKTLRLQRYLPAKARGQAVAIRIGVGSVYSFDRYNGPR